MASWQNEAMSISLIRNKPKRVTRKFRRAWNRYINGFHRLYQINNPLFQPKKEKITDEAPFFAPPVSTLQIAGASDFSVYVPYSMQKMRHRKAYSYYKQYRQQYDNAQ